MPYELIIAEKPSSAEKIASALDDKGKPLKKADSSVPYYLVRHNGKDIMVACAVGHLFTVTEKEKGAWTYPVFDTVWVPSSSVSKGADYTKKYAQVISKLAKDADSFTVATDYDIEGEVIGHNIIHYLCKQKDAKRMKFSTLTKPDLIKSYDGRAATINWGQALAGLTRHELDWYYGINLSRALTLAARSAGQYKLLSAGRVQGPALKILVDKEREIQKFVPEPYWTVTLHGSAKNQAIEAPHEEEKFFDKAKADAVMAKTKGKNGAVKSVDEKEFTQKPPTPFDLTTLQTESYRVHGISPQDTLAIAQDLYTSGWISYPRTSSQKLPKELELPKRIEDLKRQEEYKELAQILLDRKWLTPNEGAKTDEAHPAIFPTGIVPSYQSDRHRKVYDLVARRFLACFADDAKRATMTIVIDVAAENFVAKGTRTTHAGWHLFYGVYAEFEDEILPQVNVGETIQVKSIDQEQKETKPPKRYTPASLIKELEKRNLGTKATRAAIIDNLYDRGYIKEKNMQATALGLQTIDILEKYSPTIVDEQLTKNFEEELEGIRTKDTTPEKVLLGARKVLTELLADFKKKQKQIGEDLIKATREADEIAQRTVPCPACKKAARADGIMMIRRSKFGRFLGCSNHPDCTFTYKLPPYGDVKPTGKIDEKTGQELLSIRSGKNGAVVNIDPEAEENKAPTAGSANHPENIPGVGEICLACNKGKFVLRKSMYGFFLGCDNYPACKTMRSLSKKEDGSYVVGQPITKKDAPGKAKATKKAATKKTAAEALVDSGTAAKKSAKKKAAPKKKV